MTGTQGNDKDRKNTYIAWAVVILLLLLFIGLTGAKLKDKIGISETGAEGEEANDTAAGEYSSKPVEEGEVRIAIDQDLGNLDIAKNSDTYYLALNVFDRLVEIGEHSDGSTEIVPSLATQWEVSEDGKVYTFTLRDDVKFSNGKPLTSKDVKFSLSRLLTVPDSEQTAFADMIEGADALMNGSAEELTGIEIIDDTHFKIALNEPFPSFISMLGSPACSILSEEVVTAAGDSYGTEIDSIIGSGPYMITGKTDEKSTLELNPEYWGETPSVKKAELFVMVQSMMNREFARKNLDLLDMDFINATSRDAYLSDSLYKKNLVTKDNVGIIALMLNTAMPPLDNVLVRRAVQYAIDRDRIIDEVCGGYASTIDGIYPRGLIGYTEENQGWLKYDPEEAKRLLEQSGIGKDYTIELAFGATADMSIQKMIEIVQENLNDVGLNAVTVVYDSDSRLYLRRNGLIMAYQFDWYADYNDPDNFVYTIFGSTDTTKKYSSNYRDISTIARIGNARTIVDDDERLAEYAALEKKLVAADAVWVPLYTSKHIFLKGDRVKSYKPYWAGWSDLVLKNLELK